MREVRVFNEPLAIDDATHGLFEQASRASSCATTSTPTRARTSQSHRGAAGTPRHRRRRRGAARPADRSDDRRRGGRAPLPNASGARRRLLPAFADPGFDPGRKFSLPWSSTVVGLAYDRRRVQEADPQRGRALRPQFAGKVALSADAAATLGLVVLASGRQARHGHRKRRPRPRSSASVTAVDERSGPLVRDDRVRRRPRFRARAARRSPAPTRSSTRWQISPTLTFVVPTEGGLLESTNMVVPIGARERRRGRRVHRLHVRARSRARGSPRSRAA